MPCSLELPGKIIELCGGDNPVFHPNLDKVKSANVDIVADIEKPLPIKDNEYDTLFCKYGLEHVSWKTVKIFLRECYRIIKPGGKAIFITSNTLEQCKMITEFNMINESLICMLFGGQEFPEHAGAHKCGFSPNYAIEVFQEVGFRKVNVYDLTTTITDMIIEAYK